MTARRFNYVNQCEHSKNKAGSLPLLHTEVNLATTINLSKYCSTHVCFWISLCRL